ncbi:MAG: hypothetical protein V1887_02985 [Candidatus Aenigmatarchaeota archaeon]
MEADLSNAELNAYVPQLEDVRDMLCYMVVSRDPKLKKTKEFENGMRDVAWYFLNFFDCNGMLLDNTLSSDDRVDLSLYDLKEEKLLDIEKDEVWVKNSYGSKLWNIRHWVINKTNIIRLAKRYREERNAPPAKSVPSEKVDEMKELYGNVPEDVWSSRSYQKTDRAGT